MTPNRINKDGRQWELISGPWKIAEKWLMDKQMEEFKRSGIDCITQPSPDGSSYVYRCAKGYIYLKSDNPGAIKSRENRMNDPERMRMYNRKSMQRYRERKKSELCDK